MAKFGLPKADSRFLSHRSVKTSCDQWVRPNEAHPIMLPSGGAWAHCRGRLWQGPGGVAQGPAAPWGERDLYSIGSLHEQCEFNSECRLLSFPTSWVNFQHDSITEAGRADRAVNAKASDKVDYSLSTNHTKAEIRSCKRLKYDQCHKSRIIAAKK